MHFQRKPHRRNGFLTDPFPLIEIYDGQTRVIRLLTIRTDQKWKLSLWFDNAPSHPTLLYEEKALKISSLKLHQKNKSNCFANLNFEKFLCFSKHQLWSFSFFFVICACTHTRTHAHMILLDTLIFSKFVVAYGNLIL